MFRGSWGLAHGRHSSLPQRAEPSSCSLSSFDRASVMASIVALSRVQCLLGKAGLFRRH
jgi:hypothetical protein